MFSRLWRSSFQSSWIEILVTALHWILSYFDPESYFLKERFVSLSERQQEGGRESNKEREILHLLSKRLQHWDLEQAEARSLKCLL